MGTPAEAMRVTNFKTCFTSRYLACVAIRSWTVVGVAAGVRLPKMHFAAKPRTAIAPTAAAGALARRAAGLAAAGSGRPRGPAGRTRSPRLHWRVRSARARDSPVTARSWRSLGATARAGYTRAAADAFQ